MHAIAPVNTRFGQIQILQGSVWGTTWCEREIRTQGERKRERGLERERERERVGEGERDRDGEREREREG